MRHFVLRLFIKTYTIEAKHCGKITAVASKNSEDISRLRCFAFCSFSHQFFVCHDKRAVPTPQQNAKQIRKLKLQEPKGPGWRQKYDGDDTSQ